MIVTALISLVFALGIRVGPSLGPDVSAAFIAAAQSGVQCHSHVSTVHGHQNTSTLIVVTDDSPAGRDLKARGRVAVDDLKVYCGFAREGTFGAADLLAFAHAGGRPIPSGGVRAVPGASGAPVPARRQTYIPYQDVVYTGCDFGQQCNIWAHVGGPAPSVGYVQWLDFYTVWGWTNDESEDEFCLSDYGCEVIGSHNVEHSDTYYTYLADLYWTTSGYFVDGWCS